MTIPFVLLLKRDYQMSSLRPEKNKQSEK